LDRAIRLGIKPFAELGANSEALIAIDLPACSPPALLQCSTMPACESVKARNAPTANKGIKLSVMPPKPISSPAESPARTAIFESAPVAMLT